MESMRAFGPSQVMAVPPGQDRTCVHRARGAAQDYFLVRRSATSRHTPGAAAACTIGSHIVCSVHAYAWPRSVRAHAQVMPIGNVTSQSTSVVSASVVSLSTACANLTYVHNSISSASGFVATFTTTEALTLDACSNSTSMRSDGIVSYCGSSNSSLPNSRLVV